MTKRPAHFPALGEYFVSLREQKGWKQVQAAHMARRQKIQVSYQALRGLEEGTTKAPEPDLLRAIAQLYGRSYEEIASAVIRVRYGLTLGNALADARIRDLEQYVEKQAARLRAYEVFYEKARALAATLYEFTAVGVSTEDTATSSVGRTPTKRRLPRPD